MPIIIRDEKDYSVQVQLDEQNKRIWVNRYKTSNPSALEDFLIALASEYNLQKIILPVKTKDLPRFPRDTFCLEGTIDGYFGGSSGHFLSAFLDAEREKSLTKDRDQENLKEILDYPQTYNYKLPGHLTMRRAVTRDTPAMADLFSNVFKSYPTPVYDPLYLARSMSKGDLFLVVYNGNRLAAAAAAEIDWDYKRAELTNCATHTDFRGLGLNTLLLKELEKDACPKNHLHL
ncbi:hypothetical protein N752_19115 [Desulforamulus aquiferis]|nr:GNAT family N-acetyltransferase [Desulforamulus aquiferis]RYD03519.1 hypothetical protein N752_19115 [Desulforamulus aquiferis]